MAEYLVCSSFKVLVYPNKIEIYLPNDYLSLVMRINSYVNCWIEDTGYDKTPSPLSMLIKLIDNEYIYICKDIRSYVVREPVIQYPGSALNSVPSSQINVVPALFLKTEEKMYTFTGTGPALGYRVLFR